MLEAIDGAALEQLLETIGGDPEDLVELIEDFEGILPELVAQIEAGFAAKDLNQVRIAAHTLKSNARDLGVLKVATPAGFIEDAAKSGDELALSQHVPTLEGLADEAKAALADAKARYHG